MATMSTALLRATARAAFWQNFESFPDIMGGIAFRTTSDADQETYPWLAYAPGVREMTGSRTKRPVPALDWTIRNRKWENSVPIAYELRRFGKIGAVQALVGNLGQKARAYPNALISTLIDNGTATLCYDGQFFFDSDHTDPGASYSTNQSNLTTSDITTTTAPTDVEFAAAVRAAIDKLHSFKDGDGDPIVPAPGSVFEVHVPAEYFSVSRRVEVVDQLTGPVGNDLKGRFRTIHNPWISSAATTAEFFVFNPSGVRKPFIYQVADEVTLEDDADGDNEFNTKEVTFGSFGYYNVGYGDWRYAVRHLFT
jgi:phage major head subunit gpT-like protein